LVLGGATLQPFFRMQGYPFMDYGAYFCLNFVKPVNLDDDFLALLWYRRLHLLWTKPNWSAAFCSWVRRKHDTDRRTGRI